MGRPGPQEEWMIQGLVRVMDHGIRARLERDPEARRWVKNLRHTVVLELEGVGAVTVRFHSGRIRVRPGTSHFAHYRLRGPYEDLVGYLNGEVGLSEVLGKLAVGRIRVRLGSRAGLRELMNILRLEDIFVISRKAEPFPASLVDSARRAALCIPRAVPLMELLPP